MTIQFLRHLIVAACSLLPMALLAAPFDTTVATDGSEVKDMATGLIWRRCAEGMNWSGTTCTGTASPYTHEQALVQAKNQASATGKAWRVPNVKELLSITKLGETVNPSIDTAAFPATPSSYFWSSSPYVGDSSVAWYVNFFNGGVGYNYRSSNDYVRLVR